MQDKAAQAKAAELILELYNVERGYKIADRNEVPGYFLNEFSAADKHQILSLALKRAGKKVNEEGFLSRDSYDLIRTERDNVEKEIAESTKDRRRAEDMERLVAEAIAKQSPVLAPSPSSTSVGSLSPKDMEEAVTAASSIKLGPEIKMKMSDWISGKTPPEATKHTGESAIKRLRKLITRA